MSDDIVERLRACQGVLTHDPECNCEEAATEIERLREQLRAVLLHVAELRAENARMREALRNIAIGGNGEHNWSSPEMRAYAEDALRP